jgi:hypothetical protein
MKLVLKIAAGVLLGILAAFLLYLAVDMWEMNNLAKQRAEQRRLDAAMEEARVAREKAHVAEVVKEVGGFGFLPDQVIERCGQPLRDDRHEHDNNIHDTLYYLGADGQTISFEFTCTPILCEKKMERIGRSHYQDMHPTDYETFLYYEDGKTEPHYHEGSAESFVKELPCLAGAR